MSFCRELRGTLCVPAEKVHRGFLKNLDYPVDQAIPILPGYVLHVRTGSINDIPTNLCLSTHCNTTQRKQTDAILSFNETLFDSELRVF